MQVVAANYFGGVDLFKASQVLIARPVCQYTLYGHAGRQAWRVGVVHFMSECV